MSPLEVVGVAATLLCVWLVARQRVWNFPVGIVGCAAFLVVFVQVGLLAQAGLQVVFIALSLIGWYWWLRGGERNTGVQVSRPTAPVLLACLAAVVALTAVLVWGLSARAESTLPVWDALTAALSLVAQFMLSRKWIQSWYLWIAADAVYIVLFAVTGLYLTAGLYAVLLGICVTGLIGWRRDLSVRAPAHEPAR